LREVKNVRRGRRRERERGNARSDFITLLPCCLREKRGHRGAADESHSIETKTEITSRADCTPVANEISTETFSAFNPPLSFSPLPLAVSRRAIRRKRDERKLFAFRIEFARATSPRISPRIKGGRATRGRTPLLFHGHFSFTASLGKAKGGESTARDSGGAESKRRRTRKERILLLSLSFSPLSRSLSQKGVAGARVLRSGGE